MVKLWSDTSKFQELFLEHSEKVRDCFNYFVQMIKIYINEGCSKEVMELTKNIHSLETEADSIRRKIVRFLIDEGFLLPHTRRDFLSLLEDIDKVADYSEAALDYVILQSMDISEVGKSKINELLDMTGVQLNKLLEAVEYLFEDIDKAYPLVLEVDKLETEVDSIERLLISRLSKRDDLEYGLKILYRDFITMIANISDKVEDAGDEIEIIIAMRKI